jgi:hypothetical protein
MSIATPPVVAGSVARAPRDQRLDFFRGVTMLIIFIAHTPGNSWNDWIPARFGFSSGTELFIFCSGCASAGAFGRVFQNKSWWIASAKVFRRIWQIYWVQMCLILASVTLAYHAQTFVGPDSFQRFTPLIDHSSVALVALVQLFWLPDFLDILPMYIVILALLPLMEAFARVHHHLPLMISAFLWLVVHAVGVNLSGNPWTGDVWFLNPFAWQFCFMLGYSFGLKRLSPPAWHQKFFVGMSIFVLFVGVIFSFQLLVDAFPTLRNIQAILVPEDAKTNLSPARLLHFLCLAYLVLGWIDPFSNRLNRGLGSPIVLIGQQSLATFVMSIVAAEIGGFVFQFAGTGVFVTIGVNLFGFCILLGTAALMNFVKREPWARSYAKRDMTISDQTLKQ